MFQEQYEKLMQVSIKLQLDQAEAILQLLDHLNVPNGNLNTSRWNLNRTTTELTVLYRECYDNKGGH